MVEKRTVAEIALIVIFMISLGINVDTNDTGELVDEGYIAYSCDSESVPDYMCYKLSRANDDGINSYCYYNRDKSRSFKKCSTGWKRIEPIAECAAPEEYCGEIDDICPEELNDMCELMSGDDCPVIDCPKTTCPTVTCPDCPDCDGGSSSCPTCPANPVCPLTKKICIAYTDNGKYACNGCGSDAICTHEDDLDQVTMDELGWS